MSYSDPELRKRLKDQLMREEIAGTQANQWSARKSQLLKKRYENLGGKYIGTKTQAQKDLSKWSQQQWRTKSGKKSSETGERYLPTMVIESLSNSDYERTSKIKKKSKSQYSKQPSDIIKKIKKIL